MVCGSHNGDQDEGGVAEPNGHVHQLPPPVLPRLPLFQRAPEDSCVVEHGAPNDKGVPEMHARHGGQGIDKVAGHPDRCGVVMTDGVQEAEFRWEETRWHARIESE